MSWGISPNATEKEKIFADYNDSLMGMNSADGLSYHHYSKIYDIGRELADKEYQQGKLDVIEEALMLCTYSMQLNNEEYDKGFEDGVALVRKRLKKMQKGAENERLL